MAQRVELVNPQHEKFKDRVELKANAPMFNKLRRSDAGPGVKFAIGPFDEIVLGEFLPLILDMADVLPKDRKRVDRRELKVYVPDECANSAARLKKHLKKGARTEFAANLSQYMALFLIELIGFESCEDFRQFLHLIKKADVKNVNDFIDVLQKHVETRVMD